jgi:phosphate uptake regulator
MAPFSREERATLVDEARAVLRDQAHLLRQLALELDHHGVGERWQGPARRQCELELVALEEELRSVARRLEVTADYAGVRSVWADM